MQERFQRIRQLGTGAMGAVYEALDRETGSTVALKSLTQVDADSLLRFKTEFRALQDLRHRNLVCLGELVEEDGEWFMTMELIDGCDIIDYVRAKNAHDSLLGYPSLEALVEAPTLEAPQLRGGESREYPAFNERRLRASLVQLTRGLMALHAADKVHRDIKPSNILVTKSGRVALADFGFVAIGAYDPDLEDGWVVGTPEYMAPEQARAEPIAPPADWYSVGVVLYEILTGRIPFDGRVTEVMHAKQDLDPPPPSAYVAGVPADLESLAMDLMERDPSARIGGAELLRRIGERSSAAEMKSAHRHRAVSADFVGRRRELETLMAAFRATMVGKQAVVDIRGDAGVGKSSLVSRFVAQVSRDAPDTLILYGRCYERALVPFKAIDEVVDSLSRYLARLPDDEAAAVVGDTGPPLAQVFPVLRRVPCIARESRLTEEGADPQEQRFRLFAAFRALISRLALTHGLVLIIEDLQWADPDSRALLDVILLAHNAPPMLLVVTSLSSAEDEPADTLGSGEQIELENMPADEAEALAAYLLDEAGIAGLISPVEVARKTEGHPLYVHEFVRYLEESGSDADTSVELEQVIGARIERLEVPAIRILQVLAVAGTPLQQRIAARAVDMSFAEFLDRVATLRVDNLVHTRGGRRGDLIELYHDRIQETALHYTDAPSQKRCHELLALALEAVASPDAEALARHWHAAGRDDNAREYALTAAADATRALALDRAARLFRYALEIGGFPAATERRIYARLGDALVDAGRIAEAGEAYERAAVGARETAALELEQRSAECLLRVGRIDEGLARLGGVLKSVGLRLPTSRRAAMTSLVLRRARLRIRGLGFKTTPEATLSPRTLTRIDLVWSAIGGVVAVDPVLTQLLRAQHLTLALKAGEPMRVARALATESMGCAAQGKLTRAAELRDRVRALLETTESAELSGLSLLVDASIDQFEGNWEAARRSADDALSYLSQYCRGMTRPIAAAHQMLFAALAFLGDYEALEHRLPSAIRRADELGDKYTSANLRLGINNTLWLAHDDPAAATAQLEEGLARWPSTGVDLQQYFALVASCHIHIYEGDPMLAWRALSDAWKQIERAHIMRLQFARIMMLSLRGRTALALAAEHGPDKHTYVAAALRDARAIESERLDYGRAQADLLRAGAAAASDDHDKALALLSSAADKFERCGMTLHVAATNRRIARLHGQSEADAELERCQIRNAERMTRLLAPGF